MSDLRIDDLQLIGRNGKPLSIMQNPKWFCFGIDAVLVSGFAKIKKNERVLDLCTGNVIIAVLLSAKSNAAHIDAVEIQKDICELAHKTVLYNELQDVITVKNADLKHFKNDYLYDSIVCNPPYKEVGGGDVTEIKEIAVSRNEILCTLDDVLKCASTNLKFGGNFYMVHRPERLSDIICKMRENGIEPKRIRPVVSYQDSPPVMLLVEGKKGAKPKMIFEKQLVIYENNGSYTHEVKKIYGIL